MNKRIISGITILMAVALIGLVGIQLYLIGDAIKIKEATFVRDVNQAISHVISDLERDELQRQYEQQMKMVNRRNSIQSSYDSIISKLQSEFAFPMSDEEYETYLRRTIMAQEMIQEMILGYNKELENHELIQPIHIDSLIQREFKQHGINTTYEFGIFSPENNAMLFQKTGRYPQKLLEEGFLFEIFPTVTFPRQPNQLLVFFPHEKRFLISQIWDLLSISGILILIIILSFLATIFTIIRQKKLSEMKNDFINNMTHEFKTPISTISLACEALRDSDIHKTEGLYTTYISMIAEENKRLGTMAEQILQSAVMDKGEMHLKMEILDIHTIVNDCFATKKLSVMQRGGSITCELKAEHSIVKGDRVHLTNVVLNLLDNAIKYSEETLDIVIKTRNIPHAIEISVQDKGPGISRSNQKRIFEKLYRIPTGNIHNVKGFGLGLNYVKKIVEQHEGFVHLSSELKKGSTFYIKLPLYKNEE